MFLLNAGDLKFLNEYKEVMTPIAASLDVLQGEEKAYMGILLPTINCKCFKCAEIRTFDEYGLLPPTIGNLD